MKYTILQVNENNTATVEMDIGGRLLNQDFPLGDTPADLEAAVKQGMAVFKAELAAKEGEGKDVGEYQAMIAKPQAVKALPKLDPADFEPETTNVNMERGKSL